MASGFLIGPGLTHEIILSGAKEIKQCAILRVQQENLKENVKDLCLRGLQHSLAFGLHRWYVVPCFSDQSGARNQSAKSVGDMY